MRHLAFLAFLFLIPAISSAQIVINEIMYSLPGSDNDREWVEIYNAGTDAVDLTGWKFFEQGVNHTLTSISGGTVLSAGGYAVIAEDDTGFLADWSSFSGILFDSSFSLHNNGETIALKDATLNVIDEVTYDFSTGAHGDGNSLALIGTNLKAIEPTPGAKNDTTPPVITLSGGSGQHVWSANLYEERGATALDVVDGDVSANIVIDSSNVKNGEPGAYITTYTVTDISGNTAQIERPVSIVQSGGQGGAPSAPTPTGEVLGAFTISEEEKQAQIASVKSELISTIKELITLLQSELEALYN